MVPRLPINSLWRSYPATFLTTLPPDLMTSPSDPIMLMPIQESRAVPKARRIGPLSLAASTPPTVARSAYGGSSVSRWSFFASSSASAAMPSPASTVMVMSSGEYSTTRERPRMSISMAGPRELPRPVQLGPRPHGNDLVAMLAGQADHPAGFLDIDGRTTAVTGLPSSDAVAWSPK